MSETPKDIKPKVALNTLRENPNPGTQQKTLSQKVKDGADPNFAPSDSGILHTDSPAYPAVNYVKAANEKVLQGRSNANSYIVFGTDRPDTDKSGHGGIGSNRANSIDLVVGRMSSARGGKGPKDGTSVNNSMFADSARVYISQQSNLDKDFGLAEGNWQYAGPRSGIAIKADSVRVIGRESLKFVTGRCIGCKDFGYRGEPNSFGGKVPIAGPIEFIAGNNTDVRWVINLPPGSLLPKVERIDRLQPLILGKNLRDALMDLWKVIESMWASMYSFLQTQAVSNQTFATTTASLGLEALPHGIMGTLMNLLQKLFSSSPSYHNRTNGSLWEKNYLTPSGNKYICSRNVRTT